MDFADRLAGNYDITFWGTTYSKLRNEPTSSTPGGPLQKMEVNGRKRGREV